MKWKIILVLIFMVVSWEIASADGFSPWSMFPQQSPQFVTEPKTREEVRYSYFHVVRRGVPIKSWEAKIIAQYNLMRSYLDDDFDLAKPKIIETTDEHWIIRFPGKFSMTKNRPLGEYWYWISRQNGDIIRFEKNDHIPETSE